MKLYGTLFGISLFIATVSIFYVLHPSKIGANVSLTLAVVLLSASVTYLFCTPFLAAKNNSNESRIASIGIIFSFSLVGTIFPIFAIYYWFEGKEIVSNAFSVTSIFYFLVQFIVLRSSSHLVDQITNENNFQSSHTQWINRVNVCLAKSTDSVAKKRLTELSEELRYLSKDPSRQILQINQVINQKIDSLSALDESKSDLVINELRQLFLLREEEIKRIRNKT